MQIRTLKESEYLLQEGHIGVEMAQPKPTAEISAGSIDKDIKMKYFLAMQEAEMWKQRYLTATHDKVSQLRYIESSLLMLESRLQSERCDIEKRLQRQNRTNKEQKRKIAKLTTANQKLLAGMMTLSQNAAANASKSNVPLSYHGHAPPSYKPVIRVESQPIRNGGFKPHFDESTKFDQSVRSVKFENSTGQKTTVKTQRSKSFPTNKLLIRQSTTC